MYACTRSNTKKNDRELFVYFWYQYVEANNNNSIYVRGSLPREVVQAVEVPTTLEATELGRVM